MKQIALDIGVSVGPSLANFHPGHNAAALAMYQRYGYERVPERDWYPAPEIALLVLSKNIIVG